MCLLNLIDKRSSVTLTSLQLTHKCNMTNSPQISGLKPQSLILPDVDVARTAELVWTQLEPFITAHPLPGTIKLVQKHYFHGNLRGQEDKPNHISNFKHLVLLHSETFHRPKPWLNPKSKEKEIYFPFLVIETAKSQSKDLDTGTEVAWGPIK